MNVCCHLALERSRYAWVIRERFNTSWRNTAWFTSLQNACQYLLKRVSDNEKVGSIEELSRSFETSEKRILQLVASMENVVK